MNQLRCGDYVLATKWDDGDPTDHFCVGFFTHTKGDRYFVVDANGQQFRANGFRRCERISKAIGEAIANAMPVISDKEGCSLWYWRYHPDQLRRFATGGD